MQVVVMEVVLVLRYSLLAGEVERVQLVERQQAQVGVALVVLDWQTPFLGHPFFTQGVAVVVPQQSRVVRVGMVAAVQEQQPQLAGQLQLILVVEAAALFQLVVMADQAL
jgi:hypothetical protein